MKLYKLLLALVGAAILCGAFASAAFARNWSYSVQNFEATWARLNISATFGTVECEVTLRGSLHSRTFAKVAGLLMGYITDARINGACRRGEATILRETLPWHIQYGSFTGTLPNIGSIGTRLIGYAFQFGLFGIRCLWRSSAAEPATDAYNREAGGRIASVSIGGVILSSCGDRGTLSGTSSTVSAITVTLI